MALELKRKMRLQHRREHPLRQLFWECTHRCNLACRHWRYCEGNGMHLRDSEGRLMHCHLLKE